MKAVKFGMDNSKAEAARNIASIKVNPGVTDNKKKLEDSISQEALLTSKKKRLSGGGRKVLSETMEYILVEMRARSLRVTRKCYKRRPLNCSTITRA